MNYSLHCFQVDYKTGGAYSSKIPVREKQCKLYTKTKHLKYLLYKNMYLGDTSKLHGSIQINQGVSFITDQLGT